MPHKLERPSAALASPGDSDLGLVGHGRAGGLGGAGELAGELPRRVKPEAVPLLVALVDPPGRHGQHLDGDVAIKRNFDTPGEFSS